MHSRAHRHTGPPLRLYVLIDFALDHARDYGASVPRPDHPAWHSPRAAPLQTSVFPVPVSVPVTKTPLVTSTYRLITCTPYASLVHAPTSAIRKPTDSPARNGTRVSSIPTGARSIAAATGHDSSMSVMRSRFAASP